MWCGSRLRLGVIVGVLGASACAPPATPPGMATRPPRPSTFGADLVELARVEPSASDRPLLVVFPRSACSGAASVVLVDEEQRFVGAIAPGTAALLRVPLAARRLTAFSSIEVTAAVGSWRATRQVQVPALPSGLLLSSSRFSTRECGSGHYADVTVATKRELETALAEADFVWLDPHVERGQAWLARHPRRVAELFRGGVPSAASEPPSAVVTRFHDW
jgi:hypothetical protein